MKKAMFKIAGVKNDKQFYDKFPTEEAFMAKHGKTFKAQFGDVLQGIGGGMTSMGMNNSGRPKLQSVTPDGFVTKGFAGAQSELGGGGQQIGMGGGPQGGMMDKMGGVAGIGQAIGDIGGGISALKASKERVKETNQAAAVSNVAANAAESIDVDAYRNAADVRSKRYDAQMRDVNGEELFPINGRGTNVLAQDGAAVRKRSGRQPAPKMTKEQIMEGELKKSRGFLDSELKAIANKNRRKAMAKKGIPKNGQNGAEMQNLDEVHLRNNRAIHLPNKEGDEQVEALRALQSRKRLSDTQMGGFQDQRISDREWEANKQQYIADEFSSWRGGRTGNSPNRKFTQGSPEYMGAMKNIKSTWHKENPRQINPIVSDYATRTQQIRQQNGELTQEGSQYKNGGNIYAQDGFSNFMGGPGGAGLSSIAGNIMGNDGGSQIGGGIGKLAGSAFFGPVGGMVGETLGKVAGGLIDTTDNKIKKNEDRLGANMNRIAFANYDPTSAYTKYGGTFKNGGTLMEGSGEVQMGPEGDLKPISFNPYTEGGETNMIEGPSHAKGGTRLNYGGNNIEAEREPVMKMEQGGQAENLVIFGDLPINQDTAALIGDPDAKGQKFKKYVEKIADKETKANKKMAKADKVASGLTPIDKFDRLKLGTQEIIKKGSDAKLKMYAEQKESAALAQSAINETAEEIGADPKIVARGGDKLGKWLNRKMNKQSKFVPETKSAYAQNGNVFKSEEEARKAGFEKNASGKWEKLIKEGEDAWTDTFGGSEGTPGKAAVPGEVIKPAKKQMSNEAWKAFTAKETPAEKEERYAREIAQGRRAEDQPAIAAQPGSDPVGFNVDAIDPIYDYARIEADSSNPKNKGKFNPMPWLNAIAPAFGRGTDAEGLQGNQLLGEMFALSNNKVEPVYAQSYRPDLDVPYDISLQDQLNRNTSGIRAASRMAQGNPAAQAMLQAQGYAQDQPILAEQFRQNQGMKNQVYNKNRATLNDAKLKNIGIFDQQADRQSRARSNTKEATQLALNSISNKYQQNKLEQRTLKTYENMYNYRFGKNYRANNVNDPANFAAMRRNAELQGTSMHEGQVPVYNNRGEVTGYKIIQPPGSTPGWNPDSQYTKYGGSITKTLKKF